MPTAHGGFDVQRPQVVVCRFRLPVPGPNTYCVQNTGSGIVSPQSFPGAAGPWAPSTQYFDQCVAKREYSLCWRDWQTSTNSP